MNEKYIDDYKCPFCGEYIEEPNFIGDGSTVECPSCKNIFYCDEKIDYDVNMEIGK